MRALLPIGRTFFALALIGLGVEHFLFQVFAVGRAPAWPAGVGGGLLWTYLTGLLFIATGLATLAGKYVRAAALTAAIVIAVWALARHVPVLFSEALLSGAWTRAGKALAFTGGALAIAAVSPAFPKPRQTSVAFANQHGAFILAARICLGTFLVISGVQHFLFTKAVLTLIPGWFPGSHMFWAYFAGVALITGGAGMIVPLTARLAAAMSGLMLASWFVIVHLPRTFVSVSDGIALFEALAFAGLAWVIAGYLASPESSAAVGATD